MIFEIFHAMVLGIVQGLTEFLPVSSSAHLILIPFVLGWKDPGPTFDVALHAGTALAVLLYFKKIWISLLKGFVDSFREKRIEGQDQRRLAWLILVGTLPGGLAGALGEKIIEERFREPFLIAAALIALALVLLLAERIGRKHRNLNQINFKDSLLIGLSQALALLPGVSRSGITISTGMLRNLDRRAAAEFSFLLAAPIITGAALKKSIPLIRHAHVDQNEIVMFAVGVLFSATVGFLCIKYFLAYLQSKSLLPFIVYRIILGAFILLQYYK